MNKAPIAEGTKRTVVMNASKLTQVYRAGRWVVVLVEPAPK